MRVAVFFEPEGILTIPGKCAESACAGGNLAWEINREAIPVLCRLKAAGFLLIATSNQPGLSNGEVSRWVLDRWDTQLRETFCLNDLLICPHDEADRCPCRKPRPGLLTEAAFKWHLDLSQCFVVSGKWQDAEAAHAAGCTSLLIDSPWIGNGHRDVVLPSLSEVLAKVIEFRSQLESRESRKSTKSRARSLGAS